MENKKTFGAYICRRRKELGLTQREFAERLFVTESAVSKWERGMSYPDITLIHDICAVLQITEHELLTASEDVEARKAETLAKRYLRLARNVRWTQYLLYGGTALICLICDLAVDPGLDWFWLVLTGEMVGASLTLLPTLVEEHRAALSLGAFTLSVELLLLAACLFSGGDWFLLAGTATLFGMGAAILPVLLRELPSPLREHKAIAQAVIRQDEEGAERLAREHVHKLLQWVRRTQQPSLSQAASPLRPRLLRIKPRLCSS